MIVGLGNPGREYEKTRHNLGFLAVKHIAGHLGLKFRLNRSCQAMLTEGWISGIRVFFLLPMTFMNHSGISVKYFLAAHPVALQNTLVVCDDFNLDFGQLRIRRQGTDGGHHGLASIVEQARSTRFPRLRLGIGAPEDGQDRVGFVLEAFSNREQRDLPEVLEAAEKCCLAWVTQDFAKVMNQFNKRKGNE